MNIPAAIASVLEGTCAELGLSFDMAVRIMFKHIENCLRNGELDVLGNVFEQSAANVFREQLAPSAYDPSIDLSKLHRSTKTKSGYVGVYANGSGFRAVGKTPDGRTEQYIGTFKTAEEAAWKRYQHYQKYGLAYGELEAEIAAWRKRGEVGTDEQLTKEILDHARRVGTIHHFIPDEQPTEIEMLGFDRATADSLLAAGGRNE